jgi:hypothetical protein
MRINPYRQSVSPFVKPLPVPICDPDFQPVTVSVSCGWLSYILGALSLLQEQATWDTEDPDEMLLAIQRVANLREIFAAAGNASACDEPPTPIACNYDFTITEGGWEVAPQYGVGAYTSAVGFTGTYNGPTDQNQLIVRRVLSAPITLTSMEIQYNGGAGGAGADNIINFFYVTTGGLVNFGVSHVDVGGPHSFSVSTNVEGVTAVYVEMNAGTSTGPIELFRAIIDGVASGSFTC